MKWWLNLELNWAAPLWILSSDHAQSMMKTACMHEWISNAATFCRLNENLMRVMFNLEYVLAWRGIWSPQNKLAAKELIPWPAKIKFGCLRTYVYPHVLLIKYKCIGNRALQWETMERRQFLCFLKTQSSSHASSDVSDSCSQDHPSNAAAPYCE